MKKYLAYLLAFIMIFTALSVLSAVSVSAADDDFDSDEYGVPDDAFDGNYAEFNGNDGSVTRVYDNGSVKTTYKDGTAEGVDYMGNQHALDKAGNYTVRTTDGYSATEYEDGRYSLTEPGGKKTTLFPDEHYTEEYTGFGIVVETDSDGRTASIGFIGGSEKIECDEYGCYKNGEIKGPNGEKLKITETGLTLTNANGDEYEHIETGNKTTTTIDRKDGSHCEVETTSAWKSGEETQRTVFTFTDSNGDRWDSDISITYDASGSPYYSDNNVTQFTGSDGSVLWIDNNSGAMRYNDKDGVKFVIDGDGNITEYKDKDQSWNVTYNGDGSVNTADITYKDGAKMVKKPDGSASFTLPDGTKYSSDGKGNVYKNGTQIKKDGEWVPGKEEIDEPEETKNDTPTDSGELKVKNETFYGVTLPIPNIGTVTEYDAGTDSFGDEVTTIRIDGLSYNQYKEYCKILQALPGWEVYEGSYLEDVEHLPDDYNSVSKTRFTGIYGGLQHIAVQYYSDKNCKSSGYPHFCMFIYKTF